MAHITAGKVLKVAILPGVIPRTRNLLAGGFGHISFYMAQIFAAVRLLPYGHPYLNPANFGRFGIGHVTLEAWQTLSRGRWQIDQVLIFLLVLLGIVILFVQFCFLGIMLFSQAAQAAGLPADGFFNTANPETDLAFILMDSVFGLPDFFGSCVALSTECFSDNPVPHPAQPYPMPYHEGLRSMLQVYSVGLLAIAMIMFSYFAVTILIETAEHGTPFGRRFSHLWAPVRMVIAIALLLPVANGLNAAQYIIMYAAKWGSGFATNGWNLFIDEALDGVGGTVLGEAKDLIAIPNAPPVNTFLEFATLLATCKVGEASGENPRDVQAYVVFPDQAGPAGRADLTGLAYNDALERGNYGDIHYVFGVYETNAAGNPVHTSYPGQVRPVCGELVLQITDVDDNNSPGSRYILEQYHRMIQIMWLDMTGADAWSPDFMSLRAMGYGYVRRNFPRDIRWTPTDVPDAQDPNYPEASALDLNNAREYYRTEVEEILAEGINQQIASPAWDDMLDYGWAGAGIWYNLVARLNGTLLGASYSLPTVRKYPEIMEYVASQRAMQKQSGTGPERYNPEISNGKAIEFDPAKGQHMAQTLYKAQSAWGSSYSTSPAGGANPFLDAMNAALGTQGLFELSRNTDTHPLAGLVMMGKGLIEASVRNLGAATTAGLAGGLTNFFKDFQPLGKVLTSVSALALKVSIMTMVIGFLLFYVLPFIPFLYFFFAVGSWVKGIFEAIVGVPLWALAHIRIDGESLPGDAAMGGYYMVFEIFLRPILIIFGLLAAITIYAAQVKILNEIWYLVTSNVTGFNATTGKTIPAGNVGSITYMRGIADRFFYTIMYAVVVYMMGMASFKLIDVLPNQIIRWLGKEGGAFGDQVHNSPEGLMSKMSIGANQVAGQIENLGEQGLNIAKRGRN